MNHKKLLPGGVTVPIGFRANGIYAGIKKSKKKDLALIVSDRLCTATGVFTTNKVKAHCVLFDENNLRSGTAQAIIANSGNANCLTGKVGSDHNRRMAKAVADQLRLKPGDVLTGSTGVIGVKMPIEKILKAIPELVWGLSAKNGYEAAQGILTTDRLTKEAAIKIKVGRRSVRIGAIAKGAGMIHPFMKLGQQKHATMLCYVTTDAVITLKALRAALQKSVEKTFNMISIDADTSTNDMVVVLANGAAQNKPIKEGTAEFRHFAEALEDIFETLAKMMVRDAEGATKLLEISVKHAASREDARAVVMSVASSKLVKTALFGSDPNWGRIAAAVGYANAMVEADKLTILLGNQPVLRNGARVQASQAKLHRIFKQKNIRVTIYLGVGKYQATGWTCDLTTSYVRINSAYRT